MPDPQALYATAVIITALSPVAIVAIREAGLFLRSRRPGNKPQSEVLDSNQKGTPVFRCASLVSR